MKAVSHSLLYTRPYLERSVIRYLIGPAPSFQPPPKAYGPGYHHKVRYSVSASPAQLVATRSFNIHWSHPTRETISVPSCVCLTSASLYDHTADQRQLLIPTLHTDGIDGAESMSHSTHRSSRERQRVGRTRRRPLQRHLYLGCIGGIIMLSPVMASESYLMVPRRVESN